MNKMTLKTRILEFLANQIMPAFEEVKDSLGINYSDYKENAWKSVIDVDSPQRLVGFPLKLCELDFNLGIKDYTIALTVQILSEQDIGGFFTICWEHGTICSKDLFFDEISELDPNKTAQNLIRLISGLQGY